VYLKSGAKVQILSEKNIFLLIFFRIKRLFSVRENRIDLDAIEVGVLASYSISATTGSLAGNHDKNQYKKTEIQDN